jgi:hypothetical protein
MRIKNKKIKQVYRSKENFWNLYKELADDWFMVYNSEPQFIELAIGNKGAYIIYNEELFKEFIKDIKEEDNESR